MVDILTLFRAAYREQYGFPSPPVHDLCCVAAPCDPTVLQKRDAFVELAGTWTAGMTVTDFGTALGHVHTTKVAVTLDASRLWDMTIETIAALPATDQEVSR